MSRRKFRQLLKQIFEIDEEMKSIDELVMKVADRVIVYRRDHKRLERRVESLENAMEAHRKV